MHGSVPCPSPIPLLFPDLGTTAPLRVLCLDIEGGYGGSSRSLFESIRHLDRAALEVEVWCRRWGPIQERYAALNVECRVVSTMPKVSSLPRLSRNLYGYGKATLEFWQARKFRAQLKRSVDTRFDCVHFNHEALFLLARWLRARTEVPFTMHVRTNMIDTAFARWQTRTIARAIDHVVFITENEKATFERFGGEARAGSVIYNIVTPPSRRPSPHPNVPADDRFRVASLNNYAWVRGLDRLVDIAATMSAANRRDVLFVMAGTMALPRSSPGELGRVARRGGTLSDYVAACGLSDMFLFLGHVAEPERVLAACDALAKPTRGDNPWGRDILEAMAAGKPVITLGTYDRFVANGETGIVRPSYDTKLFADDILRLADQPDARTRLGHAAQERVRDLCHGPSRASELLDVWRQTVERANPSAREKRNP